jgi:Ser/Thr protein kinase RdoA (MazF antagonist)
MAVTMDQLLGQPTEGCNDRVLAPYDLAAPVGIAPLVPHGLNNALFLVTTGASPLVLKVYKGTHSLASLRYEHRLLARLADRSLPFAIPVPVPARDGATLVRLPGGWAALAPYVDASPLDPMRLDHATWLGAALAVLHHTLAGIPSTRRPGKPLFSALFNYPSPRYPPTRLTPAHFGLAGNPHADALLAWWRAEVATLAAFLLDDYRTLPQQLCHNDPAPANVLVDAGGVVALLDFEFACPAARALDLAMALRMTMRVWENPNPWPAARAVLDAYTDTIPLTVGEATALPLLIRLRSAIPVLWKLGRMQGPDDVQHVLRGITFLQNATTWLAQHGEQLVTLAEASRARGKPKA